MSEVLLLLKIRFLRIINYSRPVVYISGKISDASERELGAFLTVEYYYSNRGYLVINPYRLFKGDTRHSWYYFMRLDIAIMMLIFRDRDKSLLVSLPTWYDSRGAITERDLAIALCIKTKDISWVELEKMQE